MTSSSAATTLVMREEPVEYGSSSHRPKAQLRFLVLEEHDEALYTAVRDMTAANHTMRMVADEELAATKILAGGKAHFLLLTAQRSTQPLRVPQLVEQLRRHQYDRTINYCAKEALLPATQAAYEALTVNRVLILPVKAQRSVLDVLAWLTKQVVFDDGGLTILET